MLGWARHIVTQQPVVKRVRVSGIGCVEEDFRRGRRPFTRVLRDVPAAPKSVWRLAESVVSGANGTRICSRMLCVRRVALDGDVR